MNALALVHDLRQHGVSFLACGDELLVYAPKGRITPEVRDALVACKPQILQNLRAREAETVKPPSLADYAADRAPTIRLTLRETDDTVNDFRLLDAIRNVIQEHQPGGNHVFLKIITVDGRRFTLEWRALVARDLRVSLAGILANEGVKRGATNAAARSTTKMTGLKEGKRV